MHINVNMNMQRNNSFTYQVGAVFHLGFHSIYQSLIDRVDVIPIVSNYSNAVNTRFY